MHDSYPTKIQQINPIKFVETTDHPTFIFKLRQFHSKVRISQAINKEIDR